MSKSITLTNINPVMAEAIHPFFKLYAVPYEYTVSSFDLHEKWYSTEYKPFVTVYCDSETVAEETEIVIPKADINKWFKEHMPEVVEAYSYKDDGELKVDWHSLYIDKFDTDKVLITKITNYHTNNNDKFKN